jgi:hypothetical protein
VAEVFGGKLPTVGNLPIDAGALYLLSRKQIPEAVRDDAIARAVDGEHIKLADVKAMLAEEIASKLAEARRERDEAVAAATAALQRELQELRAVQQGEPTVEQAIEIMLKVSGKKTLSRHQTQAVAMLTGYAVPWRGIMIAPVSAAEARRSELNLAITSKFIEALQFFAGAEMPVEELFAVAMPFQLTIARKTIPIAQAWLARFSELLRQKDGEDG